MDSHGTHWNSTYMACDEHKSLTLFPCVVKKNNEKSIQICRSHSDVEMDQAISHFNISAYITKQGKLLVNYIWFGSWMPRLQNVSSSADTQLLSLNTTLDHNCVSPPRSKWVPVRAEMVIVFE